MAQHHLQKHTVKDVSILDLDIHTGKQYICGHDGCQKSYSQLKRLNEHRKTHYRGYKCIVSGCGRSFCRRFDLKEHIRTTHLEDAGKEKCQYCCKLFASHRAPTRHVKMAHFGATRIYLCKICQKRFSRKSELQQHWDAHMGSRQREKFQCGYCDAKGAFTSFSKRYNLNKHIRKYHSKEQVYQSESVSCDSDEL